MPGGINSGYCFVNRKREHATFYAYGTILGCIVLAIVMMIGSSIDAWGEPKEKGNQGQRSIYVNGVVITQAQRVALEQAYGAIQPARYWYDKVSGLWGQEGKSTMGQVIPDLDIVGPLKADASHGDTKVFLNGRELTQVEVQILQQLGPVNPGRYWVNSQGIGGVEAGEPQFALSVLFKKRNKEHNRVTPCGHSRRR